LPERDTDPLDTLAPLCRRLVIGCEQVPEAVARCLPNDRLSVLAVEQDVTLCRDCEAKWRIESRKFAVLPAWEVHFLQLQDGTALPIGVEVPEPLMDAERLCFELFEREIADVGDGDAVGIAERALAIMVLAVL
jgi:hypothetical protein